MREIHTNVSRFDFESVHAVRRRKEARLRFPRQADGAPPVQVAKLQKKRQDLPQNLLAEHWQVQEVLQVCSSAFLLL